MAHYDFYLAIFNLFSLFLAQTSSANADSLPSAPQLESRDENPNGTRFIWLPEHDYSGTNFFEQFDFFSGDDPTHGKVTYVNETTAFSEKLAYVGDDGVVYMKGDQKNWLPLGVSRPSVRISSKATYESGNLFILDVNKIPWGCATWPAFWTLGSGKEIWPYYGEIDIIEGVHDNSHNQVAWHTEPGCNISTTANFTGTIVSDADGVEHRECDADLRQNAGCGITEWSRASYGADFDRQGGGVVVMKWDEVSIAIWNFFRVSVPKDIIDGSPDPSKWGPPSAELPADNCDIPRFFSNHQIIFDITFCGDWAGNSYATTNCPGTCLERLMDPTNFVNATWSINYLKVYRKQLLNAQIGGRSGALSNVPSQFAVVFMSLGPLAVASALAVALI